MPGPGAARRSGAAVSHAGALLAAAASPSAGRCDHPGAGHSNMTHARQYKNQVPMCLYDQLLALKHRF